MRLTFLDYKRFFIFHEFNKDIFDLDHEVLKRILCPTEASTGAEITDHFVKDSRRKFFNPAGG